MGPQASMKPGESQAATTTSKGATTKPASLNKWNRRVNDDTQAPQARRESGRRVRSADQVVDADKFDEVSRATEHNSLLRQLNRYVINELKDYIIEQELHIYMYIYSHMLNWKCLKSFQNISLTLWCLLVKIDHAKILCIHSGNVIIEGL